MTPTFGIPKKRKLKNVEEKKWRNSEIEGKGNDIGWKRQKWVMSPDKWDEIKLGYTESLKSEGEDKKVEGAEREKGKTESQLKQVKDVLVGSNRDLHLLQQG